MPFCRDLRRGIRGLNTAIRNLRRARRGTRNRLVRQNLNENIRILVALRDGKRRLRRRFCR